MEWKLVCTCVCLCVLLVEGGYDCLISLFVGWSES
jgi:hypothetical protein